MIKINVNVRSKTARAEYVFDLIGDQLGISFELIEHPTIGTPIHITYGDEQIDDEPVFSSAPLLFALVKEEFPVDILKNGDRIDLFPVKGGVLDYDPFAAIFFMLSRMEEYWPHKKDKHGRYAPENSIAFRESFLHKAVVHDWIDDVKKVIEESNPSSQFRAKNFQFINTIDVDTAYAYKEKGFTRSTGALIRDLIKGDIKVFKKRLGCIFGKPDPYDVFDYLIDLQKKHNYSSVFFWLLADYGLNDKNTPVSSRRFKALIKSVTDYTSSGIHPSYASNFEVIKLKTEIRRLSEIVHRPIKKSRQHFLKFQLPDTYMTLIEQDITADFSMGYPSELGFRAGFADPFYFYDLREEKKTNLLIFPFCLMEATLKYYKGVGKEEAMSEFKLIIDEVKRVKGTFVPIWHNDSISDYGEWKGWRKIYEEMITYTMQTENVSLHSKSVRNG